MLERPDSLSDTIVACATAAPGALAIVRVSGPSAREIGARVALRARPCSSHQLVQARLVTGGGEPIDEGMVVEMHGPHSFTGEDVVELHVHGSPAVIEATLAACRALGARLARPGEFSMRALLNGKIDLVQAESIADLIASRTEEQRQVALANVNGRLSRAIEGLLEPLEGVWAEWTAALDFPEDATDYDEQLGPDNVLEKTRCKIQAIVDSARVDLIRGLRVVLCGPTNSGKSSLLNAWAGEERVLVDAEPGTTRDPVEIELVDGGRRWTVVDTAGVRGEASGLEARGIDMSKAWIGRADVALWLVAGDALVWPASDLQVEVVGSKADLVGPTTRSQLEAEARSRGLSFRGWVSVLSGEGVGELRRGLIDERSRPTRADAAVAVRERHLSALVRSEEALARAMDGQTTLDVRCMALAEAAQALGQILGRDVDLELLDRVFADFCLGK